MSGPISVGKLLGDEILYWLGSRPQIVALSLLQFGWQKNPYSPGQAYPTNPYLQCPRLMLRYEGSSLSPGPPQGGQAHDVTYAYSLFYYRRQTPGQEHQQLVCIDVESIVSCFTLEAFHPSLVESLPGWQSYSLVPVQVSYHDEMKHDFDDQKLRVSIAEISVKATGRITNCPV